MKKLLILLFVLTSCSNQPGLENPHYKVNENVTTTTTTTQTKVEESTTTLPPTTTSTSVPQISTTTTSQKVAPTTAKPKISTSGGGNVGGFLDCVKNRESRGNYSVTNPSSGAGGAYQFMPATWNNVARHIGRNDLIGIHPSQASPADQDMMAKALLSWQGKSPWNGPNC